MNEPGSETQQQVRTQALILCGAVVLVAAGLLAYSQTMGFAWDEGFHVLTAQLILRGKKPYIDFLFPQTPLNAYWNAWWMRLFGDTWRTAHAVAALCSAASVALMTNYMFRRAPAVSWRFAAAIAVVIMFGLNVLVIQFGTLGQAYGFCLLLEVVAFRLAVAAVKRPGWILAGLAGLFAGAAADSSLLTAPVAPILLLWLFFYNTAGSRIAKAAAFIAGVVIAFVPLLALFVQSPGLTVFNVIKYHLFYRQVEWPGAVHHDLDVYMSWVNSGQAVLLLLLAPAGVLFVYFRSGWERARRAEVYLCAGLAAGLALQISSAHPTFGRYYLLTVPFLSVPAAIGLYSISARLSVSNRPAPSVAIVASIFCIALLAELSAERDAFRWTLMERVAHKVDEVTPRGAPLLADEHIYFITRRIPPTGMELGDSHKLEMPADIASWAHFVGWKELRQQMKDGVYQTAETCHDDPIREVGEKAFAQHADMDQCDVYWQPKHP